LPSDSQRGRSQQLGVQLCSLQRDGPEVPRLGQGGRARLTRVPTAVFGAQSAATFIIDHPQVLTPFTPCYVCVREHSPPLLLLPPDLVRSRLVPGPEGGSAFGHEALFPNTYCQRPQGWYEGWSVLDLLELGLLVFLYQDNEINPRKSGQDSIDRNCWSVLGMDPFP